MGAQEVPSIPTKYSSAGLVRPSWPKSNVWPTSCDEASPPAFPEVINTQQGTSLSQLKEPRYATPPAPGAAVFVGVITTRILLFLGYELKTPSFVVMFKLKGR